MNIYSTLLLASCYMDQGTKLGTFDFINFRFFYKFYSFPVVLLMYKVKFGDMTQVNEVADLMHLLYLHCILVINDNTVFICC